jgi:NADH-quinone oxidoreductase subunit F
MNQITRRIASRKAQAGDIELLETVAKQIQNKCLCALGEFSTMAVVSSLEKFREDFDCIAEQPEAAEGALPMDKEQTLHG